MTIVTTPVNNGIIVAATGSYEEWEARMAEMMVCDLLDDGGRKVTTAVIENGRVVGDTAGRLLDNSSINGFKMGQEREATATEREAFRSGRRVQPLCRLIGK